MHDYRTFHSVALGESHKAKDIPCQDAALSFEDFENGIFIAAISDGHGNEKHFRSEYGSKIIVEIAIEQIKSFVQISDCMHLAVPFSMSEVLSDSENDSTSSSYNEDKNFTNQDRLIKGLISSIISNWNNEIEKHWIENKPSIDYMKARNVPDESINDYMNGVYLEYAYGCTLIAAARTPDFWFAFQIGDGTCIAFSQNAETYQPIPGDNRFSGNTTASICNDDAIDNFRYCYGNTNIPVVIFLGSDGLDGAFGTVDELVFPKLGNFYANIIKSFVIKGFDRTLQEIGTALPLLSEKGVTRDDMSLSGIINSIEINDIAPILIKKELEIAGGELTETEKQYKSSIISLDQKEAVFKRIKDDMKRLAEELKNAEYDVKNEIESLAKAERAKQKADKKLGEINAKYDKLNNELKRAEEELKKAELYLNNSKRDKDGLQRKLELLLGEARSIGCDRETPGKEEHDETENP